MIFTKELAEPGSTLNPETDIDRAWRAELRSRAIPWISPEDFEGWCDAHDYLWPDMPRVEAYEVWEHATRTTMEDQRARWAAEAAEAVEAERWRRRASLPNPFEDSASTDDAEGGAQ